MASARVTIADLAQNLGLDKSSISLALRGSGRVSEATRQRVIAAAMRLGYQPNLAARQLSSRRSHIVAMVLPPSFSPLLHGVVVSTLQSLCQQASSAGILFGIFTTEGISGDPTDFDRHALLGSSDGLLLWGETSPDISRRIAAAGRPVVVIDPSDPSFSNYHGSTVRVDNMAGAAGIARHLIDRGARHLLFVQQLREHLGHRQRADGARSEWLKSQPLESYSFCMLDELTDDTLRGFANLDSPAVFCSNDYCAMDVWHRLARGGIGVPTDVLLAGFDGEEFGKLIGLTTAVFNGQEVGKAAFNLLMRRIRGGEELLESATVPVHIRLGNSTSKSS